MLVLSQPTGRCFLMAFGCIIVKSFERSKLKISVLVCNAGLMHAPFKLTKDQIETHMQVNHLSHYLLIRND